MSVLVRLWSLRRERPVFVGVAGFVLVFFLAYPAIDWWLRSIGVAAPFEFWDFGAYGAAVNRWQEGGDIYKQKASGSYHQSYLYPPISLLLFWPFTELPNSRIVWNVFSMGVLWTGLQAALAAMDVDLALPERGLLLWALLGFQPLLLSLKFAQTPAFLTGVLCFSLAALLRGESRRRMRYASGALTAVIGMVKPSYSTVGAHLLADRERFLGALWTGLALLSLSVLVFGVEVHLTYLDVLAWGLHHGDSARSPGLWAAPYFKPLFWVPGSLFLRIGASLLIALGALFATPDADREAFALGVVAFPLLSPLTYAYYFVAVLPAFVVMLAVEFERDGHPAIPVVGLFVLSIHSYGLKFMVDVLPGLLSMQSALRPYFPLFQPGTWGLLLLIGLAAYRLGERVRFSRR